MKYIIYIFILLPILGFSQNRIVLNNNGYIVIDNSAYLVIDNSNTNAITTIGAGGNIVSENETDVIKWEVGTTTGTYIIPWTTKPISQGGNGTKIPLSINKTTAGTGANSEFILSTWETATDFNTVIPSAVNNMNFNAVDKSLYVADRFWHIDALSYTAKPDVTLSIAYDPAANEIAGSNTITETNLMAQRFNTTLAHWESYLLFGTNNAPADRVDNIVVTAANFFEDWILVDNTNPLPVTLVNFDVICKEGFVEINWTTESEINNDYFVVEKSYDATTFFELETVQGAGNSNSIISYSVLDYGFNSTPTYYRLKQVDFDGATTYFDIKTATCTTNEGNIISGYFSQNELVIDYFSANPNELEIVLFDIKGKLVFNHSFIPNNGKNKVNLGLQLAKGMYVLNLQHGNNTINLKLIK